MRTSGKIGYLWERVHRLLGTDDLADGAVTSAKIADGTIVAADLADGAVTSAKILDGTIVNADINASAAIAITKLATSVDSTSFPAVISGSTTPGTPTYGTNGQLSRYCRIGPLVVYVFNVILTATGGMAGNVRIGLPVTAGNYTGFLQGGFLTAYSLVNFTAGYTHLTALIDANTSYLLLIEEGDNVGGLTVQASQLAATSSIRGVAVYLAY